MRSKLHVYGYTGTTRVAAGTKVNGGDYAGDIETTWMDSANSKTDVFVSYDTDAYDDTAKFDVATDAKAEKYHVYLAWANPDSSGSVTYDGFEAKMFLGILPSKATVSTTPNTWTTTAAL